MKGILFCNPTLAFRNPTAKIALRYDKLMVEKDVYAFNEVARVVKKFYIITWYFLRSDISLKHLLQKDMKVTGVVELVGRGGMDEEGRTSPITPTTPGRGPAAKQRCIQQLNFN